EGKPVVTLDNLPGKYQSGRNVPAIDLITPDGLSQVKNRGASNIKRYVDDFRSLVAPDNFTADASIGLTPQRRRITEVSEFLWSNKETIGEAWPVALQA